MTQPDACTTNTPEITVSELSSALRRAIEDRFGYTRVRGEVSGYRGLHSSGHAYFCLKDANARLDAVIWRTAFARMRVKPQDGLEVIATGKLTTFAGKSSYQIVIEQLELAGLGALMAILEARRKALAEEGLFDAERKKQPPFLPAVVGVVTSPTGSVIQDILHRFSDRFPIRVVVWPVRVQGETSAAEVATAIDGFNALAEGGKIPRPDVLIVARGGGSLEDLWSFNEEIAVRAAARSAIPLVAAVGHETDWTLIDLAADLRAPTPTAAAEFAVPVRAELVATLADLEGRRQGVMLRLAQRRRGEVRALSRALPTGEILLERPRQRLDRATDGLLVCVRAAFDARALRVALLSSVLSRHSPHAHFASMAVHLRGLVGRLNRIAPLLTERRRRSVETVRRSLARERVLLAQRRSEITVVLAGFAARLDRALLENLRRRRDRLSGNMQLLEAVSYRGVLARGFALVRDEAGASLRRAAEVSAGQALRIEFADGVAPAVVGGKELFAERQALMERTRGRKALRSRSEEGQGSLF